MPVSCATMATETICNQTLPLSERLREGEGALQLTDTEAVQLQEDASKSASAQAAPRSIMKRKSASPSARKNLQFIGVNGGYESTSSDDSSSESSQEEGDASEFHEAPEGIPGPPAEHLPEGSAAPPASVTHTEACASTQSSSTDSAPQQGSSQSPSTEPSLQRGTSQLPSTEPAAQHGTSQSPSIESALQHGNNQSPSIESALQHGTSQSLSIESALQQNTSQSPSIDSAPLQGSSRSASIEPSPQHGTSQSLSIETISKQSISQSPSMDAVPQPSTAKFVSINSTLQEYSIQSSTKDPAPELTATQSPVTDPACQPSTTQSLTIDPATESSTTRSLATDPTSQPNTAQSPTTDPTSQPSTAQSPPTEPASQSSTAQPSTGPAAQQTTQEEGLGDPSSGHSVSQETRESSHSRLELSDSLTAALVVLQKALSEPNGFGQQEARAAYTVVLQEWLRVSCHKTADTGLVRAYMDAFASVSPQLLEFVVNMADGNGNTALHYTVSHSNFPVVKLLLDTGVCNTDKQNKAGYTAIMLTALAAFHSDSDLHTVVQLLRTGDVNAKASQAGQTALMLAVSHGRGTWCGR
ncbi:hypothetical protein ANANG_G00296230 [Anguilla anguilla]|uniref:KN motif and ankyrin repeat domains 4 n=1 Tax=Anguilla anguilla TaxID=7936 RepID=A0A9D3LME9_ANGAN|nr:hypothetical protein ANANG_G00296230 [Anguilla anguilla]